MRVGRSYLPADEQFTVIAGTSTTFSFNPGIGSYLLLTLAFICVCCCCCNLLGFCYLLDLSFFGPRIRFQALRQHLQLRNIISVTRLGRLFTIIMADKEIQEEHKGTSPDINTDDFGGGIVSVLEDGSLDPVYEAKAKVLNKAIQDIGMGKYQWQASTPKCTAASLLNYLLCHIDVSFYTI